MRNISFKEMESVVGGMITDGYRESDNIIDLRGEDMGYYIDANGMCWEPGSTSEDMYGDRENLLS